MLAFILLQLEKMKNVKINGNTFYFKKFTPVMNGKTHLTDLYKNASIYKWQAFNYWKEKLDCIYGLLGNSCTYSIYGQVTDENGQNHDVKITAWHNYILS